MAGSKSNARQSRRPVARPPGRYRIQALDRAAAILNCFDVHEPELNVRDVGERTGLHKSTAHRILMALQHNGFVEQNPASGRYHLGLQLVKLGEHAVARLDVAVIARPFIGDLAARTGRRVHLAVMDGAQIVILDRADGSDASSIPSLPGRLFPAHCTALGKAMLAGLDEAENPASSRQTAVEAVHAENGYEYRRSDRGAADDRQARLCDYRSGDGARADHRRRRNPQPYRSRRCGAQRGGVSDRCASLCALCARRGREQDGCADLGAPGVQASCRGDRLRRERADTAARGCRGTDRRCCRWPFFTNSRRRTASGIITKSARS